jgi:hypothetical protein
MSFVFTVSSFKMPYNGQGLAMAWHSLHFCPACRLRLKSTKFFVIHAAYVKAIIAADHPDSQS